MAAFNKFQSFVGALASGTQNMASGTPQVYKVYLSDVQPVVTNTTFGTPAEITAGNGYTAGGQSIAAITGVDTAGVFSFSGATNPSWTASAGSIGPFQFAVLYNSTTGALIGWWDYGLPITLTVGNTFIVSLPAPIATLT